MKRVRIKPAAGIVVLDEAGNRIPAEGKEVVKTTFISRRIKEGSLEIVKDQKPSTRKGAKAGDKK